MQASCPQCATRIQIEDAKLPDRPFKLRCPKCQALLSLPGRPPAAVPDPASPPASAQASGTPGAGSVPPNPLAAAPSVEALDRQERLAASHNDALIALSGPAAPHLQQTLARLGFNVDLVDDVEEGARLLEQGAYEVAVTAYGAGEAGRPETLAQRMLRLAPDTRHRVFVVLVGEQFRSGDGTQAWAAQADLVLHPADAPRCESLVRATLAERKRLYQTFLDARRKVDSD